MDAARSGGWRVFTSTLRALSRLGEVRLAALVPDERVGEFADLAGQVTLVPVPVSPAHPLRNLFWHATRLPTLVSGLRADVLHVPTHNLLVARKVCPTVVTIHDITEFHLRRHYDPVRTLYRHAVVPRNARLADRIATVSRWTGDDIVRTLGVPQERVVVAPNGVEPAFQPVSPRAAPDKVKEAVGVTGPYLLYVGQIHMPNKNLVRLVEAFAQARARLPAGTTLVLAGREVTGAGEVREAVRRAGVEDAVRWLGYVPDGALPALYSGAVAFCYPSLQEGFGLPVLEAMACGTPVVTSSSTALLEIARDAALLVDPYDVGELGTALVRAATDADLRARLRDAGLKRAAGYTWDRTARILAGTYLQLGRTSCSTTLR